MAKDEQKDFAADPELRKPSYQRRAAQPAAPLSKDQMRDISKHLENMHGHLRAWAVNEGIGLVDKNAPHANATFLLKECQAAITLLAVPADQKETFRFAALEEALDGLEKEMRHAVANPMRAWSTGEVIAASTVEAWADELREARAAIRGVPWCAKCDGPVPVLKDECDIADCPYSSERGGTQQEGK